MIEGKALETTARMFQGQGAEVTSNVQQTDPAFQLDLGLLETKGFEVRGSVPKVKDLKELLALIDAALENAKESKALLDMRRSTREQIANATEYDRLAAQGLTLLGPADRKRFFELLDWFRDQGRLKIDSIQSWGTSVDFQAGAPQLTIHSEVLAVSGVSGKDFSVGYIKGRNVTLAAR